MPFVYGYGLLRGGELDVSSRRLRPALLLPSTAGYFSVTKAGCVGGSDATATEMRVVLPGRSAPLTIALPVGGGGHGVSVISYCLPEGGVRVRLTPGDYARVSPIERKPPACIHEREDPNESEHESELRDRACEAEQDATANSYGTTDVAKRPAWEEA
jgi:hypothetical protein